MDLELHQHKGGVADKKPKTPTKRKSSREGPQQLNASNVASKATNKGVDQTKEAAMKSFGEGEICPPSLLGPPSLHQRGGNSGPGDPAADTLGQRCRSKTGAQGEIEVISLLTVLKLGIRTRPLTNSICFEQVNRTRLFLTESMRLEMGRLQYLVQRKGYPLSEATWVESWDVKADRLVKQFYDDNLCAFFSLQEVFFNEGRPPVNPEADLIKTILTLQGIEIAGVSLGNQGHSHTWSERGGVNQLVKWDKTVKLKLHTTTHSLSMEQLGEMFGGLEIKGSKATMAGTVAVTIPSPPLLQPVEPASIRMIGSPLQGAVAVDFADPGAQVGLKAPPPSLLMAAVILQPGYITMRDERPSPPSLFDDAARVHTVASNLEVSTARWLMSLHENWDPMVAQHAESHICTLKQGKWPMAEYIQDFRSLTSQPPDFPKCMLVSYFRGELYGEKPDDDQRAQHTGKPAPQSAKETARPQGWGERGVCPRPEEASLIKLRGPVPTEERRVINQPNVSHHNQQPLLCPPANPPKREPQRSQRRRRVQELQPTPGRIQSSMRATALQNGTHRGQQLAHFWPAECFWGLGRAKMRHPEAKNYFFSYFLSLNLGASNGPVCLKVRKIQYISKPASGPGFYKGVTMQGQQDILGSASALPTIPVPMKQWWDSNFFTTGSVGVAYLVGMAWWSCDWVGVFGGHVTGHSLSHPASEPYRSSSERRDNEESSSPGTSIHPPFWSTWAMAVAGAVAVVGLWEAARRESPPSHLEHIRKMFLPRGVSSCTAPPPRRAARWGGRKAPAHPFWLAALLPLLFQVLPPPSTGKPESLPSLRGKGCRCSQGLGLEGEQVGELHPNSGWDETLLSNPPLRTSQRKPTTTTSARAQLLPSQHASYPGAGQTFLP
ncbi:hypothetical protein L345_11120, partial [Ophiophagus hannah]